MKNQYFFTLLILLLPLLSLAQPDFESIQQNWIENVENSELNTLKWDQAHLLFVNSEITGIDQLSFLLSKPKEKYQHLKTFKHDKNRYMTIGTIGREKMVLASGWRRIENSWRKELDVFLNQESSISTPGDSTEAQLTTERRQWVMLANQNNPTAHIAYSYATNATYFANGRRSDGTNAIAGRYAYMKNPNYTVDLEKEYLRQVSQDKVLEIGRYYAGQKEDNPGGLYLILWQKNEQKEWKINLDFNF